MRIPSEVYRALPRSIRRLEELTVPVQLDDPSEAIRSGEILAQLRIGFDIEACRGYGGNLLAMILPNLELERVDDRILEELFRREDELLEEGAPDFYAVIVARPKRGWRASLALFRYFLEPKLKRVGREARALVGRRALPV